MANLSPEQEAINRIHLNHQARGVSQELECPECIRQRNWQPPSHECNWCDARLPNDDSKRAIEHNEWHLSHPESITK